MKLSAKLSRYITLILSLPPPRPLPLPLFSFRGGIPIQTYDMKHTSLVYQTRRDGEIQLHPLEQREADLAEELHRQKEKERLRKECMSLFQCQY
jgi:hypothetical protein